MASGASLAIAQPMALHLEIAPFGELADGTRIDAFTLDDDEGILVRVISLGGIITELLAPDRTGTRHNVVLGCDTLDGYLTDRAYLGALIGRYANRIGGGQIELDGRRSQLPANDGRHHLHGGPFGFHRRVWTATPLGLPDGVGVLLRLTSPDGDQGYPGTLRVAVQYTLRAGGSLTIDYSATTDATTVINLTQHSYFNLRGDGGTTLDHDLSIDADWYTPVTAELIPTGVLAPVAGTPFDFRTATAIGARLGADNDQLRFGRGYDHNWVLREAGGAMRSIARVADPFSGLTLEVASTEPGLQFYAGGLLEGALRYTGFCLETQHFPDSPNQPSFPSVELRPHQQYRSTTSWTFGAI